MNNITEQITRCRWVNERNPLYVKYHDEEWGVPSHEDAYLYEMLILEMFVAGLSWECVLNKRAAFREAFAGFDAPKVAVFGAEEVAAMLQNAGIIRHRAKIEAAITNTRVFLQIQHEFGCFIAYVRGFAGDRIWYEPYTERTTSPLSNALARDMKRRGMRFLGAVTVYSWLQAVGIIHGHGPECMFNFACGGQR